MKDLWIARDVTGIADNDVYLYNEQPTLENGEYESDVLGKLALISFGYDDILDHIPIQKGECYKISFTKEESNGTS